MSPWTLLLIGISTVFASLILIALGISLMRVIFTKKTTPVPHVAAAGGQATSSPGINGPLVAVIAAAIAAATGQAVGSFRIAAIQKTGLSTPAWGHVDRLARAPRGRSF
ncbi:MAG: hypothetical protein A2087_02730 [Spirochaetes bacterium GWD1_61_31]|nr:MAG: hypothetical protein A2Y37_03460 [Spirochaetes bacterium GWB1_60_80]OHD29663.1 MAG: hypothetical protein A2004_02000 [Spirochaetes bacterium GWC1_61_12]OHD44142.1 MAG: hypothetical protein A2087_02730 [Spirochaetes bacterium GWD1_61_31]OHD46881.1 MAG: hypothetical protein A2Y35_02625 [Spirochaetes bacterium GWE1_60_18]OHD61812.1 MAG: hypothetical protein A2Y32_13720 [Spirochaetes bacterium GWF1_60_12]